MTHDLARQMGIQRFATALLAGVAGDFYGLGFSGFLSNGCAVRG